jgi:hypothetical protein
LPLLLLLPALPVSCRFPFLLLLLLLLLLLKKRLESSLMLAPV